MKNQSSKKYTCVKNRIISILFVGLLAGLLVFWMGASKSSFSQSERRLLATAPALSVEAILEGTFMEELQAYMMDTIPFRDEFRRISSWMNLHAFQLRDSEGVYIEDGHAVKMEYPLKEDSVDYACDRFSYIYDTYLKGTDTKVYLSIIPDKNYFLAKKSGHLAMDYDGLVKGVCEGTSFATYLNIFPLLQIEDYYKTDVHWRQEQIEDVAVYLAKGMNTELKVDYQLQELNKDYYGVYSGQTGGLLEPERVRYLTNQELKECKVYDYEHRKDISVYDMEKAYGRDPYEMFLSGAVSLITIDNPNATTKKELIIFRDSFGSSLAPLFVNGYSKITLVDIRYIPSSMIGNYVDFDEQDVLFLYETQVLNNSITLK